MELTSILLSVLGSSALTTLIVQWFTHRKVKADANVVAMDGTVRWAESMRKDLNDLRNDFKELQAKHDLLFHENIELRGKVARLEAELAKYKKVSKARKS